MKTIVLMGDPNVGKSVLFSRLTGVNVIASNYPGTTVDYSRGRALLNGEKVEVIDAPGTYSLDPSNKAEEVAVSLLDKADLVINVVDSTSLERCLLLTIELLKKRKPVIIALNMWDEAQHLGINIDTAELESMLKVPVVSTVAITGEGVNELVCRLDEAVIPEHSSSGGHEEEWIEVGHIVEKVQNVTHRHHTIWDRIEDATVKPVTGLFAAAVIMSAMFGLVRLVGEGVVKYIMEPLFELYRVPVTVLSEKLSAGFAHDVLIGKLVNGEIDYVQSMGMLTTGFFVPFGMVLPYIMAFYLSLALLEDSGYLPRLVTVTDNVFHKLGMHGHGIVAVLLGAGCNVPGVLSTRALETRKQRFLAATLVSVTVPCAAQSAMIFGILGRYGARYIMMVFGTLMFMFILLGLLLNRITRGECPELFLDIPPYRRPSVSAVVKKTWMRIRWFLAEAIPFLFLGVLAVNILNALGVISFISYHMTGFMKYWFGLPGEAVPALLSGFLRKDLAVGMLVPMSLSPEQLTVAVTVLTLYFPCVATFTVLLKELGVKDMAKSIAVMILTSFMVGGIMKLILMGW